MPEDDLTQADLSHLRVDEMTPEERAEMRRRYVEFVNRHARPKPAARRKSTHPPKWISGKPA